MSKKTVKVEAQLNRVDALQILRDAIGNDTDAVKALDVFTRVNTKTANARGFKADHVLVRAAKTAKAGYIADRVELADGMTVAEAMKTVPNGHHGSYRYADIAYDIARGYLQDPRS
tara:strand:- start:231 stop:578 length:348 start_codon:yes stop_codon:yes gene_type:complete